jgi:predicted acylesterase/phospholipase RssA
MFMNQDTTDTAIPDIEIEQAVIEPVETEIHDSTEPIIRHLVISGGGLNGLSYYGALRDSSERGIWNANNLQTVYGCSFGSILAAIIALKYDWNDIDDYIIKRPWENVFNSDILSMLNSISDKGIYSVYQMEAIMAPLLRGKDLSPDINLYDFFQSTALEIHIFTTDIHAYKMVDLSYKTHPQWRLVDAIYASCAIPIIFAPHTDGSTYYYDGAFFANYPTKFCVENGANPSEILGITALFSQMGKTCIEPESTMFDCVSVIFGNILHTALQPSYTGIIGKEYKVVPTPSTLSDIYNTITNREERSRLVSMGAETARMMDLTSNDTNISVSNEIDCRLSENNPNALIVEHSSDKATQSASSDL